jgi:hypothetical protein
MRTIGQLLVFLGIITGIQGIGLCMGAWRHDLGFGVVAIALPVVFLSAGGLLIRRSKPVQ